MNLSQNNIDLFSLLGSIRDRGSFQVFQINLAVAVVRQVSLRVGKKCAFVIGPFLKETNSFFHRFISSSKFSFVAFWFSTSAFNVDEATDIGLL